mgnify:CR=1 FL=1
MATNKTNLSVNSLDFDTIKNSLKVYLQGQDTFKDYDFDGAGLNMLLDILAYNTHMEAFYNNMVANEMFIDSAVKRSSLSSIAKHLGYTPTSPRAATATIDLKLGSTAGMGSTTIIPIGSKFTASVDGRGYNFINLSTASVSTSPSDGIHVSDLEVKEGLMGRTTYVFDANSTDQTFLIPEKMADTTTLTVRVQSSATDTTGFTDSWSLATDLNDVTSTTKAYWLQENMDGKYEVYFGDDVIGKKPTHGNLVIMEYLITSASLANDIGGGDTGGSRVFSYGSSNNEVIVKSKASGGSERESSDSIRHNAPRSYQAQGRAVTVEDYKSILQSDYPDVESINIWGGEENDPPEYGTVVVSFKPSTGTIITEATKDSIERSLAQNKGIIAIRTKIVDPNYIYLYIDTTINYDPMKLSISELSLETLVRNAISSYVDTELEKFSKGLRHSKFVKDIDDTNTSILGNETILKMEYRLFPVTGKDRSYTVEFGNKLFHPYDGYTSVITSSPFNINDGAGIEREAYLEDDGNGVLKTYYLSDGLKTTISSNAGTVDYEKGIVRIVSMNVKSTVNDSFIRVHATPSGRDVDSTRNTILTLDNADPDAVKVSLNKVSVLN